MGYGVWKFIFLMEVCPMKASSWDGKMFLVSSVVEGWRGTIILCSASLCNFFSQRVKLEPGKLICTTVIWIVFFIKIQTMQIVLDSCKHGLHSKRMTYMLQTSSTLLAGWNKYSVFQLIDNKYQVPYSWLHYVQCSPPFQPC